MASGALHGREIKMGTKVQGEKDTLSTGVSKSESAKVSKHSTRLQLGEEHDIHKKKNITSDKQNVIDEKLPSSLGEVSQQLEKNPSCRESLSMSDIDNGIELAAKMMYVMPS